MQVIISLPEQAGIEASGGIKQSLMRKICGVPQLTRSIATAGRSGGTTALLLYPKSLPESIWRSAIDSPALGAITVQPIELENAFDPDNAADWQAIEPHLEERFLWMPWDYAVDKYSLSSLVNTGTFSEKGVRFAEITSTEVPAIVVMEQFAFAENNAALSDYLTGTDLDEVTVLQPPGVRINSAETARQAERLLVRRSGKESDGVFSTFNRRLCRPFVRGLSKTPITPNMISFGGLFVALASGIWYAQGYWTAYVLGGLFYFVSVMFDEMDGMLARVKFKESAFGCWLETHVDSASYFVVFIGMTIGLYRESGPIWLVFGGLLLFGTTVSLFAFGYQRKIATTRENPNEYLKIYHRRLEDDSGNILSRFARLTEFVIRKAPISHFLLIFSVLGGLKVIFLLAVLSSNVAWAMCLSFNRLFRALPSETSSGESY